MNKPHLNILHINSNRWNSAITEYSVSSTHALHRLGHKNLYVGLSKSPSIERLRKLDLPVLAVPGFGVRALKTFKEIIATTNPDAIITYGGPETTLTRLLALQNKHIKYFRFRGHDVTDYGTWSKLRQNLAHGHVEKIICPSSFVKDRLIRLGGHQIHNKIVCIPLGCNTKYFYRKNPDPPNSRERRPTLLIFGRFDPVKGHREFLDFFAKLVKEWPFDTPKPLLKMIGQSANISGQELQNHINTRHLSDHALVIEKRVEDVAALMSQTTLGVVSSLGSEIICRVAQEFLLCGTPIAVSNAGSLAETLVFPEAGFAYLTPPENQRILVFARKLYECYNEPQQVRLDRAQKADSFFSLNTMGFALENMIRSVVQG